MTGEQGFQKSQPGKGNRHKRPKITVPQDPGGGTWLPDLEMNGFIKEVTFEAGFEERVDIFQVRRGLGWKQTFLASLPLRLQAPSLSRPISLGQVGDPCPAQPRLWRTWVWPALSCIGHDAGNTKPTTDRQ